MRRLSDKPIRNAPKRSNLIVTRAGRNSLHREWVSDPDNQNFDLLVAAYDASVIREDEPGIRHRHIPGHKVTGWMTLFDRDPWLLEEYDQVALIDDDIQAGAADLSHCFDIGRQYGLKLWQPSLTWDSYATYGATLRNASFRLRYVNYVEMMCPFFTSAFLREVLPTFALGLESGIDLVWCSIADETHRSFAIVDEVSVKHTRSVGKERAANGFVDRRYESDIHACLDRFGATWPSCVATSGVGKHGDIIEPQFNVALKTLPQLMAVACAPKGNRMYRLKCVSDHIRHQLTRKPTYASGIRSKLVELEYRC